MENQKEEIITSPELEVNDKKPAFLDKAEGDWTTDDAIEAKQYAQTLYGQKEHWKHKASKKEETPPEKKEELKKTNNDSPDDSWREKLELKVEGFSETEIDFIQRNGGKTSLNDPLVKQAIDTIREKSKAENAVITEDNKSDVEKKYSSDELKGMPTEELEKLLPKAN